MEHGAVILAGERAEGSPLARQLNARCGALVEVAGEPCLHRVLKALQASSYVRGGTISGPSEQVVREEPNLFALLNAQGFSWQPPLDGPAASAAQAAQTLTPPTLITTADHALLSAATVDRFCVDSAALTADFVVGLVPYAVVRARFPDAHRTVLKFRGYAACGSNLFMLKTPAGSAALNFWRALEAQRKKPLRLAAALGPGFLLRYLCGRLTLDQAFHRLSALAGCRVGWVEVADPLAAVDIDSYADWQLAEQVLA